MWTMGGQRSGAGRVKQVLVVTSLPICKCWLLLGGVFGCWIRGAYWWTVGRTEGLGEIPVLLQGDGDVCGRRYLLEGVV
jgi:hypothetical protein